MPEQFIYINSWIADYIVDAMEAHVVFLLCLLQPKQPFALFGTRSTLLTKKKKAPAALFTKYASSVPHERESEISLYGKRAYTSPH